MIEDYRKECQANSQKIVELKVELELIKNENREIKNDFASRINFLEQRSRINNLEVVGLGKPTNLETDTKLTLDFFKEAMEADVEPGDLDALHEVPSKRKDGKRIVGVAG